MSVKVTTPIYRASGIYFKDAACEEPFTNQHAAELLWKQKHAQQKNGWTELFEALGGIVIFSFFAVMCYGAWESINDDGWIPHNELTRVSAASWSGRGVQALRNFSIS
jgi:hypothetical protein